MWFCSSSATRTMPADAPRRGSGWPLCRTGSPSPRGSLSTWGLQVKHRFYLGLPPADAPLISGGFLGPHPLPDWHVGSGGSAFSVAPSGLSQGTHKQREKAGLGR